VDLQDNDDVMPAIEFSEQFAAEQIVSGKSVTINLPFKPKQFFRNGWQSWSLASWIDTSTPLPVQKPRLLHAMQLDPTYAFHSNPHGSWVGAVEMDNENILMLGSLGLDAHVELNNNQLRGWYESGSGDWFVGYGTEQSIFARYAELLGERLGIAQNRTHPRVWCSWYSLYTAINEQILSKVIDSLGDLPFDTIQIDDGWQAAIGDWQANKKFPSGMTALSDKIKFTGRKAGLWLAPLIAVKSSRLFQDHPNWFLRDNHKKFVSAGFNWGEELYTLDTTYPEVLTWLAILMKQVSHWGFEYVKLDFLFGGGLPGHRYLDIPREAAYRNGLKVLREALGKNTFILACGAPILPSLGLCDALRIGPDVASEWENTRDAVLLYNPTIPSTRNAIRTSIHRRWLDSLVQTDPDVVYFRSMGCSLNDEQKSLLQDLAIICNFKATSDLPQWLNPDERKRFGSFLKANPKIKRLSRYAYQIDGRTVDFSSAVPLPERPRGYAAMKADLLGWFANRKLALKIDNYIQKIKLVRSIKDL
jgi:alpha-galactosidase